MDPDQPAPANQARPVPTGETLVDADQPPPANQAPTSEALVDADQPANQALRVTCTDERSICGRQSTYTFTLRIIADITGLLGTYGTKGWPHLRRDIKQTTDRAPRMVEIRNKQWHLDETGRNLDTVPRNRVGRPSGIFFLDEIRVDFPDPSRWP
nr:hypothetical protein Itr_chr15CG10720 [Ipomoea trifida]